MTDRGQENRRLVLVRLRSLGDTVLMTPLLEAARRRTGLEVGVVVEEPFDQVLEGNPHLDRLFVIPRKTPSWLARIRTLQKLRAYRPETVIDLHGGTTAAIITGLSGARRRVGYAAGRNTWFYNIRIPEPARVWGRNPLHTVEHQLAALHFLDLSVEPVPPLHVPVSYPDRDRLEEELKRKGVDPGFVLIHPGAAFETKQWDATRFGALARRLVDRGHQVVVTAGPGQDGLLSRMKEMCPPAVVFFDPLPLRGFVALASLCGLYVANDTGPTHVAAALGKKIVAIFGSSDPGAWRPWGVEYRLLQADLPCIPCPGYYCLHYDEPRCIRSIEVDDVDRAVGELL